MLWLGRIRDKVKVAALRDIGGGVGRLIWINSSKSGVRGAEAIQPAEGRNSPDWKHLELIVRWFKQFLLLVWRVSFELFMALLQSCFLKPSCFRDRSSSALIKWSSSFVSLQTHYNTDKWQMITHLYTLKLYCEQQMKEVSTTEFAHILQWDFREAS